MGVNRDDLFLSLPAHVVEQIEALIDEAAEDGYQNGYESGYGDAQELYYKPEKYDNYLL